MDGWLDGHHAGLPICARIHLYFELLAGRPGSIPYGCRQALRQACWPTDMCMKARKSTPAHALPPLNVCIIIAYAAHMCMHMDI